MKISKSIIWLTLLMVTIAFTIATAERRAVNSVNIEEISGGAQYLTIPPSKLNITSQPNMPERELPGKAPVIGKQGGEDVDNATVITGLPFNGTGTTVGYADDYDPLGGGCTHTTAPDVVYSYFSTANQQVNIITCNPGTDYWTKIYVYENDTSNILACNMYSDICFDSTGDERGDIYSLQLYAGETYYIVVDGGMPPGISGNYELTIEALPPWIPSGQHPALDEGGWGMMALAYEDGGSVWYGGSIDEAESWIDFVAWNISGTPTFPSVDYWGNDSTFYGTMVCPDSFASGAGVFVCEMINVGNPYGFSLPYWNWEEIDPGIGWYNMKMNDMACDDSQEDWEWGMISLIWGGNYTSPAHVASPYISYQTSADGYSTISWFNDLDGCSTTTCDIDRSTHKTYAVYDRFNPTESRWDFIIRKDDFSNWDGPASGSVYSMSDHSNIQFPVVSAYNNSVVVVMENWAAGTETQKDIVCFSTVTGDISGMNSHTVVATNEAERYPEIEYIAGRAFICTFIKNNTLYATVTEDAGGIWSTPAVISEVGDSVVSDYRAVSITESDGYYVKIIYEYYDTEKGRDDIALRMIDYQVFDPPDTDGDGYPDPKDNCPNDYNDDQLDSDFDRIGDVCDNCPYVKNRYQPNSDGDSHGDDCDNCPAIDNEDQLNSDTDSRGDVCDNCPTADNEDQANSDGDTYGDVCDNCPDTTNEDQLNSDLDTFGDVCDNCPDSTNQDQMNSDNDSHGDVCDNCPDDDNEDQADGDGDGIGDVCDGVCGDINGDELINIFDITGLIDFLYQSGPPPVDMNNADVNSDLTVNIFDITYLIDFLYQTGPDPDCP